MDRKFQQHILADYSAGRKVEPVTLKVRRAKLKAFAKLLAGSKTEFYAALSADLNRDFAETLLAELIPLLNIIRYMVRKLPRLLADRALPDSWATFPSRGRLVKEPYGRVLVISTWNYPVLLALEPALGAYAAGNRVILKLSPRSPHSNNFIRNLLEKIFSSGEIMLVDPEAGLPELLQYRYDYIFCTGSRKTGQKVLRAAAENCTPATLELGGKNPCIVADDADLAVAAKRIVWGKFFNAGQSCAAPDYLLVHRDVKAELMNLICKNIRKMYGEHPLDKRTFPAMPDREAYERICRMAAEGRVVFGGDRDPEKLAFEPTVIDRIEADSPLLTEEIFGPLLPVLDFSNDTELFRKLQLIEHPLALYCFGGSRKLRRNLRDFIPCGALVFNDVLVHFSNMHIPFGGVGYSGSGAYHGARTVTTFVHEKPVLSRWNFPDCFLRYPPYGKFFRKIVEFLTHVR